MPFGSTLSYAWGHGGGGGYYGGRGYGGWGGYYGYGYWPYDNYYPDYYDAGVIVSSPIVETPEIIVQPSTTVVTNASAYSTTEITPVQINTTDTDNELTINIPNAAGGYTSVLIKRSGKGFIGPQGEFYPEFPRVSVLKVMYGK
jgi:hypothetical protein